MPYHLFASTTQPNLLIYADREDKLADQQPDDGPWSYGGAIDDLPLTGPERQNVLKLIASQGWAFYGKRTERRP